MAFSKQVIAVALLALSAYQASAAEFYDFTEGQSDPPGTTASSTGGNTLGDIEVSGGVEWIGDERNGIQFSGTSGTQTINNFNEFTAGKDGITIELWLQVGKQEHYQWTVLTNRLAEDLGEACEKGSFAINVDPLSARLLISAMDRDMCVPIKPHATLTTTLVAAQSEPLHIIVTMKYEDKSNYFKMALEVYAAYSNKDLVKEIGETNSDYAAIAATGKPHWGEMFEVHPLSIGSRAFLGEGEPFDGKILVLRLHDTALSESEIAVLHTAGPPNSRPQEPIPFTQEVEEDATEQVLVCEGFTDANGDAEDSRIVTGSTMCADVDEGDNLENLKIVIDSLPQGCAEGVNGRCGILLDCADPDACDVTTDFALTVGAEVPYGNLFFGAEADEHSYTITTKTITGGLEYIPEQHDYASFTYHLEDPDGAESLEGTATIVVRPAGDEPLPSDDEIDIYSEQTINIDLLGTDLDSLLFGGELVTYTRAFIETKPGAGQLTDVDGNPFNEADPSDNSFILPDSKFHACATTSCLEIHFIEDDTSGPVIRLQYKANPADMSASGQEDILTDTFTFYIESRTPSAGGGLEYIVSGAVGTITLTHKNPLQVGGTITVDEDKLETLDLHELTVQEMEDEVNIYGLTYRILTVPDKGYIYQRDTSNSSAITQVPVDVESSVAFLEFDNLDLENEYNCAPSISSCLCTSEYCTAEDYFTSFTYEVMDDATGFKSAPGTLYVSVAPTNDAPTLDVDSLVSLETTANPSGDTTWEGNITLFDEFDPYADDETYVTTIDMTASSVKCWVSVAEDEATGKQYGAQDPRWRGDGYVKGDGINDLVVEIMTERTLAQEYLARLVFTVPQSAVGESTSSRCRCEVTVKDGKKGAVDQTFDMFVVQTQQAISEQENSHAADLVIVYTIWSVLALFGLLCVGLIVSKIRSRCKKRKKNDANLNPYLHAT